MGDLELFIHKLTEWVHSLNGCPENWLDLKIVEDSSFIIRSEAWELPKAALLSVMEYEDKFSDLLSSGYSWINLNFGGIHNDTAIVFVEYPKHSSGCPKDKVTVNLSGPDGNEWDLSKKLRIVD